MQDTIQPYVQPAVDIGIIGLTLVSMIPSSGGSASRIPAEAAALGRNTSRAISEVEKIAGLANRVIPAVVDKLSSETATLGRMSTLPEKLYHYTASDTAAIMREGLISKSGTNYATPSGI